MSPTDPSPLVVSGVLLTLACLIAPIASIAGQRRRRRRWIEHDRALRRERVAKLRWKVAAQAASKAYAQALREQFRQAPLHRLRAAQRVREARKSDRPIKSTT